MHDNNICPHCKQGPDSQKHALSCTVIALHLSQVKKEAIQNIKHEDIYGDSQAQLLITQIYQSIISIKALDEWPTWALIWDPVSIYILVHIQTQ